MALGVNRFGFKLRNTRVDDSGAVVAVTPSSSSSLSNPDSDSGQVGAAVASSRRSPAAALHHTRRSVSPGFHYRSPPDPSLSPTAAMLKHQQQAAEILDELKAALADSPPHVTTTSSTASVGDRGDTGGLFCGGGSSNSGNGSGGGRPSAGGSVPGSTTSPVQMPELSKLPTVEVDRHVLSPTPVTATVVASTTPTVLSSQFVQRREGVETATLQPLARPAGSGGGLWATSPFAAATSTVTATPQSQFGYGGSSTPGRQFVTPTAPARTADGQGRRDDRAVEATSRHLSDAPAMSVRPAGMAPPHTSTSTSASLAVAPDTNHYSRASLAPGQQPAAGCATEQYPPEHATVRRALRPAHHPTSPTASSRLMMMVK